MSTSRKKTGHEERGDSAFLRLTAAVVVFLLCLGLTTFYPEETAQTRNRLAALLSSSTDFHAAFSRLGARLEQGDDVAGAVGDWCLAVFAPADVTVDVTAEEPPVEPAP